MDNAALVSTDLEQGENIMARLDGVGLQLSVVLWLLTSEFKDWRLCVASPRFDKLDTTQAYGLLNQSLDEAGFTVYDVPQFLILPMSDPFIRALRKVFGRAKSLKGMRLGGQLIGDRWVEHAYVYRIA